MHKEQSAGVRLQPDTAQYLVPRPEEGGSARRRLLDGQVTTAAAPRARRRTGRIPSHWAPPPTIFILTLVMSYEALLRSSSSAPSESARPLCSALPELRCRRAAAGVSEACLRVVSERWSHQLRRPLCLTRHDGQWTAPQSVWRAYGKVGNRSWARSLCARWMSFAPYSTLRPPEHACFTCMPCLTCLHRCGRDPKVVLRNRL